MKTLKSWILLWALCLVASTQAQTHSETINKSVAFSGNGSNNLLVVYNIHGGVEVEGYNGSSVEITAEKWVKGRNSRSLQQGKTEIQLGVVEQGDIVYVYLDTPNVKFNPETGSYKHEGNWQSRNYDYSMDIKIRVPKSTNLELSAINDGDVVARNIFAKELSVSNINGGITLDNVTGKTYVNALNRDITINYAKAPTGDSTYKSLNGDINITVPSGLDANVSFKSLNGDFYTNLETRTSPSEMKVSTKSSKRGTRYKMNSKSRFSIGKGGVEMDFDVLNGDVTIKG